MANNTVLKGLTICLFLILMGAYVAYRSGVFDSKDKEIPVEINETEVVDSIEDSIVGDDFEKMPDSLLNEIYLSSSKVIRVVEPSDFEYLSSSKVGLLAKPNELLVENSETIKMLIESYTEEKERLEKPVSPNNPIIIVLEDKIRSLKVTLKRMDSIILSRDDK